MPKILFVARHVWPSGDIQTTIQRFLHTFVWSGSLGEARTHRRAWLSQEVAQLPAADGGIGMPCVRTELLRLSDRTVARWAAGTTALSAAVGRILLQSAPGSSSARSTALSRLPPVASRVAATIAATGLAVTRERLTCPRTDEELRLVADLLPHAGKAGLRRREWVNDELVCDYREHRDQLCALRQVQRSAHGKLSLSSLLAAPVVGAGFLLSSTGEMLRRHDLHALLRTASTIGDVVSVRWRGSQRVAFKCRTEDYPVRPRAADQFRVFCDLLVFQYPGLLLPQNPEDVLQPRPPTDTCWRLTRDQDRMTLHMEPVQDRTVCLGTVTSTVSAARLARQAGQAVVTFDRHPWLDPFAPVWAPTNHPTACLSSQPPKESRGAALVRERAALACTADARIGKALGSLSWARIARLPASSSYQRLLLHKIKGVRLSGWDRVHGARGCPHCPHSGSDGGHTFHIVWHCSSAQALWNRVLVFWRRLGLWRWGTAEDNQRFLEAVFTLKLPSTPPGAWVYVAPQAQHDPQAAAPRAAPEIVDPSCPLLFPCYLGMATRRRRQRHPVDRNDSSCDHGEPISRSSPDLARIQASCVDTRAPHAARQVPGARPDPTTASTTASAPLRRVCALLRWRLERQPRPWRRRRGGRPDRCASHHGIHHMECSHEPSIRDTTNTQAEYFGLITGLAASRDRGWCPLHVVGDSALIIGQLRDRRPPKNVTLRRLYAAARHLADSLGELSWSHHLRSYNKMADTAANVAMDGRCSIQTLHPTDRSEWAGLHQHLEGDFSHWRESHCGPR